MKGDWIEKAEREYQQYTKKRLNLIQTAKMFGIMNESINDKKETTMKTEEVNYVGFEMAINALQEFKRVGFRYWDKDTFIFMQVPAEIPYKITQGMQSLPDSVKSEIKKRYENLPEEQKEDFDIRYRSQIAMMLPDGTIKGYGFSPSKVLSNNWIILDQ